ncbi:putative ATPase [Variovorax boronicumulans]|uniref:AAA family ATPase n=1 Tax=Variovorax boronicumulans TaxID=436515 RepID=UPI0027859BE6|nr:AAA family ATPase [Variovorax boronicumulans]MDP9993834.1 putative ATPase [Variovorax boronicumulans]MDQ0005302.1 putative ATPase [Variovorax boronicumulans]
MATQDISDDEEELAELESTPAQERLFLQLTNSIDRSLETSGKPSFTYVIGNNGTGKSRLLARLAQHYGKSSENQVRVIGCISNSVFDRFTLSTSGPVQYLGARTSGNAVFHTAIDRTLCKVLLTALKQEKKRLHDLQGALGMEFSFLVGQETLTGTSTDLKKIVDRRKLKGQSVAQMLSKEDRDVLAHLVGSERKFTGLVRREMDALLNLIALNPEVKLFVRRNASEKMDFKQLSTGEQNRALTFAKVLSVAGEQSLILIDEPEISLHLHWQMDFHQTLRTLLSKLGRFHVVVATHSPIIISEGAKSEKKRSLSRVVVLDNEQGEPQRITAATYTFNEVLSHEQLVLNMFDTAPYRTVAVDWEITKAILTGVEGEELTSDIINTLDDLRKKQGVTKPDQAHIDAAIAIIKRQTLTHLQEDPGNA